MNGLGDPPKRRLDEGRGEANGGEHGEGRENVAKMGSGDGIANCFSRNCWTTICGGVVGSMVREKNNQGGDA